MPGAFERAGLKFISEIGGGSGSRFREEKARSRTKVTVRISSPAGTGLAEGTERTAAPSRIQMYRVSWLEHAYLAL